MGTAKRRAFLEAQKERIVRKIRLWKAQGTPVAEACRCAGISKSQYYRWREQYGRKRRGELDAMRPKSRRPKRYARQTSAQDVQRVVNMARSRQYRSANAIAEELRGQGSKITCATVINILERAGLYGRREIRDEVGNLLRVVRGLL